MTNRWFIAALLLGLTLGVGSRAEAVNGDCPDTAGTEFIVDNSDPAHNASLIAGGYLNLACTLIIKVSVTPNITNWKANAKAIQVLGDGVTPLEIINTLAASKVQFLANNGNIFVQFATIKARDLVNFNCKGVLCRFDVDDSIVIASPSLDVFNIPGNPGSGFSTVGDINVNVVGDIDIQRSTFWGGAGIHMNAKQGGITWFCPGPGAGGCLDPLGPPFVVKDLCGDPPVFPCTVQFQTPADLKKVCFPGTAGSFCGGGRTEVRVTAFLDIDIRGSAFTFTNHVTFESVTGSVLAGKKNGVPSTMTVRDNIHILAKKTVDLSDAIWTTQTGNILIETGSGCATADPGFCINAFAADIESAGDMVFIANNGNGDIQLCSGTFTRLGAGVPKFNGVPPYPASVVHTAPPCATAAIIN